MKKYDLLKNENRIIRVLAVENDRVQIIDCIRRTMPVWIEVSMTEVYSACQEKELLDATGMQIADMDTLDAEQKKTMYDRYTLIAPILSCLEDAKARADSIRSIAERHGISKQTVRSYLCLYLCYLDISVLAPAKRICQNPLSESEKNMRWALNKFFYTTEKHSLHTAYVLMLKEKYCDEKGILLEEYPSFYQFRYFYRKTKKMQNYYISRNGLKNYQRNYRPLTGEGVKEFAPAVGVGMLDATVCDIYLVNDSGSLVGRPILTACIDAYSGLCCGYHLSWEGGVYSLRGLMLHIIADKKAWCMKYGISIDSEEWPCHELPGIMVTDMGSEYKSENFEQIAELGVEIVNLPSYRPELKGPVEKFFDVIQDSYKKHLKGKGVVEADYQERGAHDYRKDACLTVEDFEKIILYCIIYYNSRRIVENFPYTKAMTEKHVKPYANCIWNWGRKQMGANLIPVKEMDLILTLMPRTTGRFTRYGLKVNKLRYHCEGYTEQYLKGGEVTVAYNPEDVTYVWLLEGRKYIRFSVIESQFEGKDLVAIHELQMSRKAIVREAEHDNLQAQIDLAWHIENVICGTRDGANVNLKNIRNTRKLEQRKYHRDYMEKRTGHE